MMWKARVSAGSRVIAALAAVVLVALAFMMLVLALGNSESGGSPYGSLQLMIGLGAVTAFGAAAVFGAIYAAEGTTLKGFLIALPIGPGLLALWLAGFSVWCSSCGH